MLIVLGRDFIYLDIWVRRVIIIIKDAIYVSVVYFAEYAFIGFYIRFSVYDHYYIIAAYILLCHMSSISPVSCHEHSLLDITCYISTCSCMHVLTTRFSMHVYDSDLSIHVCLSMHTIWH